MGDNTGYRVRFLLLYLVIVLLVISSVVGGTVGGICGDRSLDPGEECDDGNTDDLDGCSSVCLIEGTFYWAMNVEASFAGPSGSKNYQQNFPADWGRWTATNAYHDNAANPLASWDETDFSNQVFNIEATREWNGKNIKWTIDLGGIDGHWSTGVQVVVADDTEPLFTLGWSPGESTSDPTYKPYHSGVGWGTATTTLPEGMYVSGNYNEEYYEIQIISEVWVDDDYDETTCGAAGLTWQLDCFDNIQDGINAVAEAGIVNVAAGSYNEMLTIDKPLNLNGANAGIHPAVGTHPTETVGTRGPETILTHNFYAIHPQADDITIDGIKFTGAGGRIIDTYADADNFHLTNCIFDNPSVATTQGVIQFGGGSHTDMLIDFNLFQDKGDHTLYTGGVFDRLNIAYNKFNVEGDSIFWTADPLVDGIIEGNEFDGEIDGVPGTGFNTINIGNAGNIIVRDNWFHDCYYTPIQIGVIGGSIIDNTFEKIYPYPSIGADSIQLWGGQWGTSVSTDVTIENNRISFNDIPGASDPSHAIRLRPGENPGDPGVDAANVHINNNIFEDGNIKTDAFVLRNQGSGTADAENNWWGTLDSNEISALIQGTVDYSLWKTHEPPFVSIKSLDTSVIYKNGNIINIRIKLEDSIYTVTADFDAVEDEAISDVTATNNGDGTYSISYTLVSGAELTATAATKYYIPITADGVTDNTFSIIIDNVPPPPPTPVNENSTSYSSGTIGMNFGNVPGGSYDLTVQEYDVSPPNVPTFGTGSSAGSINKYYEIESTLPDGEFEVTLTFSYPDADQNGIVDGTSVNENDLKVYYYDETAGEWINVGGTVDTIANTITVTVDHFTAFTIIGGTTASGTDITPGYAKASASNIGILDVVVQDASDTFADSLATITITSENSDISDADVSAVKLYLDDDGDGNFEPGTDDTTVLSGNFAANQVTFNPGWAIADGTTIHVFVAYNTAAGALHGNILDASIAAGDIILTNAGASIDEISPSGSSTLDTINPTVDSTTITGSAGVNGWVGSEDGTPGAVITAEITEANSGLTATNVKADLSIITGNSGLNAVAANDATYGGGCTGPVANVYTCTWNNVYVGLTLGTGAVVTVKVDATDNAGSSVAGTDDGADGTAAVDKTDPITSGTTVIPDPTSSTLTSITASTSDGNSPILKAEYFIDTDPGEGAGIAMDAADGSFNSASENVKKLNVDVSALAEGEHTVYVRGQDSAGNWGPINSDTFILDKTAPETSGASISPDQTKINPTLTAAATDALSNIKRAKYSIDCDLCSAVCTEFSMTASDGTFDELSEDVTATINIAGLADGTHTAYVRSTDIANNQQSSACSSDTFVVDKTNPSITSVTITGDADYDGWVTASDAAITVVAEITEATSGLTAANARADLREVTGEPADSYVAAGSCTGPVGNIYTCTWSNINARDNLANAATVNVYIDATDNVANSQSGVTDGYGSATVDNVITSADAGGPYSDDEGSSIDFDASGSSDSGSGISAYEWDFSYDGTTFNVEDAGATTSYPFSDDGTYTVAVRITDNAGNIGIDSVSVIINNIAPTAPTDIDGFPANLYVGDTLTVTGSGSTDVAGDLPLTYYYKFENVDDAFVVQDWSTDNSYTIQVSDAQDTLKIYTKANDGTGGSPEYSKTDEIDNTIPTDPTDLTADDDLQVGEDITALCSDSTDADDDPITYDYQFYNIDDAVLVQDYTNGDTYTIQVDDAHD
ncbi:MAG: PKD domain-containing protein, partial [Nanoarchaeota archaeon]